MDTSYIPRTATNQPVHAEHTESRSTQSPCKAALVGLGMILIIGAIIAAGVLFTHMGYSSLACLSVVPIGVALIVAGFRCRAPEKSENPAEEEPLPPPLFEEISYADQEFPIDDAKLKFSSALKLQQLLDGDFLAIIPQLDDARLALASSKQLNLLPWDKMLEREDRKQMVETIIAWAPGRLKHVHPDIVQNLSPFLNGKHLSTLEPKQFAYLDWKAIIEAQDAKQTVRDMFPTDPQSQAKTKACLDEALEAMDANTLMKFFELMSHDLAALLQPPPQTNPLTEIELQEESPLPEDPDADSIEADDLDESQIDLILASELDTN